MIATIAILAALLLPILSRAKIKAQRTVCFSNLRQLGYAWVIYAGENNGYLVESYPVANQNAWVQGDVTNPSEATNADLIAQAKLYHYNRSVAIYRCPSDEGQMFDGKRTAVVRSYAMNSFMGGRDATVGPIPETAMTGYTWFFAKDSDISRPSEMWVLIDQDERSINDGFFITDPTAGRWIDFPAMSTHRHNFTFTLSFADGHSEFWHPTDARTFLVSANQTEQSGNPDLGRLAKASTTQK